MRRLGVHESLGKKAGRRVPAACLEVGRAFSAYYVRHSGGRETACSYGRGVA